MYVFVVNDRRIHKNEIIVNPFLEKISKMNDFASALGGRIKKLRGNLSQEKFAELININVNTLRGYESGQRTPGADTILALHQRAGANFEWLLAGLEPKVRPADSPVVATENKGPTGADHIYKDEHLELYEKLVQSHEREIAMLNKYVSDLKAVIAELKPAPSLSATEKRESV